MLAQLDTPKADEETQKRDRRRTLKDLNLAQPQSSTRLASTVRDEF